MMGAARAFNTSMRSLLIVAGLAFSAGTPSPEPAEFITAAKPLHTGPAAGEGTVSPSVQKIVDHHGKAARERMDKSRALYFDKGRTFFDKLVPADAPAAVVYPFGGGDLLSALVAFPNATEITT